MLSLIFLLSSALVDLGTSPLVDEGHVHDWAELPDQADDEIILFDDNWRLSMAVLVNLSHLVR